VQEAAGEREADALGLRHGGELGLAAVVEEGGVIEAPLQVVATGLESVELLAEAQGILAVGEAAEVIEDGRGRAVKGLSAEAVELGESCDIAVAAEEDSGGAGDAIPGG
jgi:hypothetical protein